MQIATLVITIIGLAFFEVVSSIDNAVVNAEVLQTMSKKAKRWFLVWGVVFAVFVVRGILPWAIIWLSNPSLGIWGAFSASFSNNPSILESIEKTAPTLLVAGGIFLLFLFFSWLFLEPKHYGLFGEKFFRAKSVWFYGVVSIILTVIVYLSLEINPMMAFGAVVGSTAFFITNGFKQNAEKSEKKLLSGSYKRSDLSKILYLEIIDATFSIDGVLGAFAFTLSVPLIIIGNGIGAIILRNLTVSNIDSVKKYIFLKNGAMYSIFFLSVVMLLDSFGFAMPQWISPLITVTVVGYFFIKSHRHLKRGNKGVYLS